MTNPEVAILMLTTFIVLVMLGFPVAFTLLAMGVGFGYYAYYQAGSIETIADAFTNNIFYLLNQNTYSVMENDTLVAGIIPMGLFYHACISLAVGGTWFLATIFAWPFDENAEKPSSTGKGGAA